MGFSKLLVVIDSSIELIVSKCAHIVSTRSKNLGIRGLIASRLGSRSGNHTGNEEWLLGVWAAQIA